MIAPVGLDAAVAWVRAGGRVHRPDGSAYPFDVDANRLRLDVVAVLMSHGLELVHLREWEAEGRFAVVERLLRERGRSALTSPDLNRLASAHFRHLYLIEVLGAGTKVGITAQPQKRLKSHTRAARDYGREIGRVWFSLAHMEARENEQTVIAADPLRREMLGVTFDTALGLVARLPMTGRRAFFDNFGKKRVARAGAIQVLALALLAFLAAGCTTYHGPRLPTQLHIPADTPEGERGAWEAAAADWNAALLADAVTRIDDRATGCGVFVVPRDERIKPGKGGYTQVTAPCRVEVQMLPGIDPSVQLAAARHEVGHALRDDNWHSANPFSVLFRVGLTSEQMPTFCELFPETCDPEGCEIDGEAVGQEIQAEELEFVRARLRPAPIGGV